jgi:hypothetical protein
MTTNPYWTEDGKAKNLALLTSTERCKMLETLRQTEAREWLQRYRLKEKQFGKQQAQDWWEGVKLDIKKRRGQAGVVTLTNEMNRQRNDANSLSS